MGIRSGKFARRFRRKKPEKLGEILLFTKTFSINIAKYFSCAKVFIQTDVATDNFGKTKNT